MRLVCVIVAAILGCFPATGHSQSQDKIPDERRFKVLTYNVQFLPGIARALNKYKEPNYRAETISSKLIHYDLIGLNELFDQAPRDLVVQGIHEYAADGSTYQVQLPPTDSVSRYGVSSGLAVVTRFAVLQNHYLRYGNDSSPRKYGLFSDGYAAKGVIHTRLNVDRRAPKLVLDVFVTHLESQIPTIREKQVKMLADFMQKNISLEHPFLLLGDMNVAAPPVASENANVDELAESLEEYNEMMQVIRNQTTNHHFVDNWLSSGIGVSGTSSPEDDDGGERIDYIFVANAKNAKFALHVEQMRINRFPDARTKSLSDHSAVEADLILRPR